VGAPIKSPEGEIMGAISISGPTKRLKDEWLHGELTEMVTQAANFIEMKISTDQQAWR
jgi:DNA-binding IclR family transcriptional regulator